MNGDIPMAFKNLTPHEVRVLATLFEKAQTVPDSYPLTLNSLILGCNQKTSREPVMELTQDDVLAALESLKKVSCVFELNTSRVAKYEHNLMRALNVTHPQAVILGLLMLRGPQTPAELRMNGDRWYKFVDSAAAEAVLLELQERGDDGGLATVQKLPKAPGSREHRWVHLLAGPVDVDAVVLTTSAHHTDTSDGLQRITRLENTVAVLKAENAELKQAMQQICEQLGIELQLSNKE